MAFIKKLWKDRPDKTTPISAAGLNNLENRINTAVDLFQGGVATTVPTGKTVNHNGITWHESVAVIVFAKPYKSTPSISTSVLTPSAYAYAIGNHSYSITGFSTTVWRINNLEALISWVALPQTQ